MVDVNDEQLEKTHQKFIKMHKRYKPKSVAKLMMKG